MRASAPHADLMTINSSTGRIGRSMSAGAATGAVPGPAVIAGAGALFESPGFLIAGFVAVRGEAGALGEAGAMVFSGAGDEGAAGGEEDVARGAKVEGAGAGARADLDLGAAAGVSMAFTAFWHEAERLDMFFCKHCSAGRPPGGTLVQCAI
jgi:hypothetical protein